MKPLKGFSVAVIPKGKPAEGTKVVTLHYSADPTMTPERVAHLKGQYPDKSTWDREMEIDDSSRSGQKIFPDFDESIHVVQPRFPLKMAEMALYNSCDPHPRTPHAFVWLAAHFDGSLSVIWSWWPEKRETVDAYAEQLSKFDRFLSKPDRRIMDVAGKAFNASEDTDYFKAYRQAKNAKGESVSITFQPAKKNRNYTGFDLINQALKLHEFKEDDGTVAKRPLLTIWAGCGDNPKLIAAVKNHRWRERKGIVLDKNEPEEPEDKDRHLIDCLSYIMLDGPKFIERRTNYREEQDLNTVISHGYDDEEDSVVGDS